MKALARTDSRGATPFTFNASREVRNLANLSDTAATSRVLNLSQVFVNSAKDKYYQLRPFFRDSQMNKAILVKHTLRANERELFPGQRRTATKIILPFDPSDLKLGGRSIFVSQVGFDSFCRAYFNLEDAGANSDVQILKLLDHLPSLDPFLVREHLARGGFKPAPCYLKISAFDVQRMMGFVNSEVERLVRNAFGNDGALPGATVKLAGKILANETDKDLWPLKKTLSMTDAEFADGIFSWRGFLYFKWRHLELQDEMRRVVEGLASYQPYGPCDDTTRDYMREARPRLARKVITSVASVGRTLGVYDKAYRSLVEKSDPAPFRRFLIEGPDLFQELGESIGILGHIGSFWAYRIGQGVGAKKLTPAEYTDVLMDFEDSLRSVPAYVPAGEEIG